MSGNMNARRVNVQRMAAELPLGTDQGVDVLDRQDIGEAGADCPGHGVQRLAGGVGHQVNMEIGPEPFARLGHRVCGRLWIVSGRRGSHRVDS